ncbi:bifunctional DNA primase/polymerase [Haloferax marisrubri]|uniref:DNA primase/polymerase bifunctional N-terminal domain-containing protein n=1 Tax=Haloferax marisrubri TaxID=1544719 RepID=A0A2P4NVS4_9EURY|nr:bifunctional DNA primase/polymerase [Haloferax marisrubri]POG57247.1 hypothetical protein AUR65_001410 [Haloferax marisrubri]
MSKETIAERLEEAGVGADRLVDVHDGEKKCTDHTHLSPPDVSGNYGVRATAKDELVIIDVDDYKGLNDKSGLSALMELPPTLEEKTPHGGTHRFFVVPMTDDGRTIAAVFEDEFGKKNPNPSWGEVRVANQYVVAAGSQLDGCDKGECDECSKEDGGRYELTADGDRPIATVSAEEFVEVLSQDPNYAPGEDTERTDAPVTRVDDEEDVLGYALNESNDGKLQRLWRGDCSDYDGDRSEAESALAYKLSWWLQGDKQAVRRAMDRSGAEKWAERTDDSYRDSILEAVDEQRKEGEFFDPDSTAKERAPTYDEEEVKRGETLLAVECSPTNPAGEMEHRNGHYGYWWEKRDEDGQIVEKEFNAVTNFTLETLEHLQTDEGDLLKIRVHPAHPMEDEYDVDVHPTVFNETRKFKEEIVRGRTTRYEPGKRNQTALNDLRETVGTQMVPERVGVEHIGLAGDEYNEWVSPLGTLTADGSTDDPDHRYYAKGGSSESKGGSLARKWKLDPETLKDYDKEDVARIVELLPQTRRPERGLSILGWFYAAPLRPLIHDWEGEFNLLQVVGSTGTGKTSTLEMFWEAFGMDPDPFSASDTVFTLTKHMSSSSGVPVWIDEYKPADIDNRSLDKLHRRLREVTKGGAVSKGKPDLGEVLFKLKAPVVVSGEQRFSQNVPAVRRRALMTTLSDAATNNGSEYARAFSELTGTAYEDENGVAQYPKGYDLMDHARAYYRFILGLSADELHEAWKASRQEAAEILSSRGLTFQNTEFQAAQTVLFGIQVFRSFAESVGADMSALPTREEIGDAFEHYASNIGKDGKRMGYDDGFLELFAQAASNGYLERDVDFRFMDSQKFGSEVLAFHMPTANAAVRRYVRDYNLDDEYTLVGKNDYLSAFRDKSERSSSHIKAVNHTARLDGGRTKCVVIDPHRTGEVLGSGFDLRAFGRGNAEEDKEAEETAGSDDDGGNGPAATAEQETQQAAADGGDDKGPQWRAERVVKILATGERLTQGAICSRLAKRYDIGPDDGKAAIKKAVSQGSIVESGGGEYRIA